MVYIGIGSVGSIHIGFIAGADTYSTVYFGLAFCLIASFAILPRSS